MLSQQELVLTKSRATKNKSTVVVTIYADTDRDHCKMYTFFDRQRIGINLRIAPRKKKVRATVVGLNPRRIK